MFEMRLRTINCGIYIRMVMERCSGAGRDQPTVTLCTGYLVELSNEGL